MTSRPFSFPSGEGLPIRGDLHSPGRPGAPVIVCIHGFKGFKDWGFWPHAASRLREAGYGVVRFNFSHSGIGADLETFSEVGLFESGTYTREMEDLGKPPVQSVVLWNPVSSVLWWDEETRQRWRETGLWETVNPRTGQVFRMTTALLDDAEQNRDRLHPAVNAGRLRVPVLAVVAAQDETVPPAAGLRIASAAGVRGSVHGIAATGHTFGSAHPFPGTTPALEEAIRVTREHFDRTIAAAAP